MIKKRDGNSRWSGVEGKWYLIIDEINVSEAVAKVDLKAAQKEAEDQAAKPQTDSETPIGWTEHKALKDNPNGFSEGTVFYKHEDGRIQMVKPTKGNVVLNVLGGGAALVGALVLGVVGGCVQAVSTLVTTQNLFHALKDKDYRRPLYRLNGVDDKPINVGFSEPQLLQCIPVLNDYKSYKRGEPEPKSNNVDHPDHDPARKVGYIHIGKSEHTKRTREKDVELNESSWQEAIVTRLKADAAHSPTCNKSWTGGHSPTWGRRLTSLDSKTSPGAAFLASLNGRHHRRLPVMERLLREIREAQ